MIVKVVNSPELVCERLPTFVVDNTNKHLFTKVKTTEGNVFLRKNRLDTVLYVDAYGIILKITGKNPGNKKPGQSVYK